MTKFIKTKYKESLWLLQNKGIIGFINALRLFTIRKTMQFIYRNKPDRMYYLLQKRLRKIRNNANALAKINDSIVKRPLISVLLIDSTGDHLKVEKSLHTVFQQEYKKLEILILTKESVEFRKRIPENKTDKYKIRFLEYSADDSEAGNLIHLINKSNGEFLIRLLSGEILETTAFLYFVNIINKHPVADVIYSDEDLVDDQGNYYEPLFKPGYSPHLLYSYNYIHNAVLFSRKLVEDFNWKSYNDFEEVYWYCFVLEITARARKVVHLPDLLYHNLVNSELARFDYYLRFPVSQIVKCLEVFFQNRVQQVKVIKDGIEGVCYVKPVIQKHEKISIIIPFRDRADLLQKCIESIDKHTSYPDYELVLLSNNSQEITTYEYIDKISDGDKDIRIIKINEPFNFSRINNFAVNQATGQVILFLNNDIEVVTYGWLEEMYSQLQFKNAGAVGAKLLYPDYTVQHAGVVVGIGGCADHVFKFRHDRDNGYMLRANVVNNYSACTAACLMIRRTDFESIGGFDEKNLTISFNDVDLCLKIIKAGKYVVYNPNVKLIHHESVTRGDEFSLTNKNHLKEVNYLKKKWNIKDGVDMFYNINFSLETRNFDMKHWYRL